MAEKREKYYKNSKKWREHEQSIAMLNVMAQDPEFKYYLGVAAGAGIASVAALLGTTQGTETSSGSSGGGSWEPSMVQAGAFNWLMGPVNPVSMTWFANKLQEGMDADKTASDSPLPGLPLNQIMAIGGTGFAGFCASVLLLKAIFGTGSDDNGGGLLSMIGKVV